MSNAQSLLHNVYLFKDLTPSELELIAAIAKVEEHGPGTEIFTEGDAAHSLYVIKFGSVKIQHSGANDRVDVATLGTGSHFGEMAFIDKEKRSASSVALERAEIVKLDYGTLQKILDANPGVAVKVYRAFAQFLSGRLRMTTNDLTFAREKNFRHF
jgi:CRP-like cAMP-binding protein